MLNIIYFSNISGNTHRLALNVQKHAAQKGETLSIHRIPLTGTEELEADTPYILISPSYGSAKTGHVPPQVKKFLKNPTNIDLCIGVIGAGNINFGTDFAAAGYKIAEHIQKPLLYCVEMSGLHADYENIFNIMMSGKLKQLILTSV